jgi:hypothetical protein
MNRFTIIPIGTLMIGKHFKGKAFYPILNYALSKQSAQLITTNMAYSVPADLAQEFSCLQSVNAMVERCMYHASLSLPMGEWLEDLKWGEVAQEFLDLMGFDSNPYVVVRHHDRAHDHIHIISSRIRFDGSCVFDRWDHYRLQAVTGQLERMFELTPIPASWEQRQSPVIQSQAEIICRPQKKRQIER